MDINSVLSAEKEYKKKFTKRAGRAIAIAMLSCALMMLMQIVFAFIVPPMEDEVIGLLIDISVYVSYLIIPFGLAKLAFITLFKKDKDFVVKHATPKKPALYIFGAIGAGYLVNIVVNMVFGWLLNNDDTSVFETPKTPLGIILTYLFVAVLPAILEEWAFRGVLLKYLRPYGRAGAIVISSFLFGLMHIDIARVIFATVFGILLAICYDYTNSIKVTMLIHFINNAIATTVQLFMDNTAITLLLSMMIYAFMGLGIAAIIYYSISGIKRKKVSIIKPVCYGYKLGIPMFIRKTILNVAAIPLFGIYIFFLVLLYIL